jgi:Holliday junction DNA helicase RuvB
MEDFKIDILIGEGQSARSLRIDLYPFTLVGATTRSGMLTHPLRERFGIPLRLQFYDTEDLLQIIKRASTILGVEIDDDGALEIARRSRGTPRIAGRLLKRVRDFAFVLSKNDNTTITHDMAQYALGKLDVDSAGLDTQDIKYLRILAEYYRGGPAGIETIAAALAEDVGTIEDIIEPYLLQQGFVQRTARGRVLTELTYAHLHIELKENEEIEGEEAPKFFYK